MLKKLLAALTMFYAAVSFAAVDVNTATAADLDSVKGIGPAMSTRIIDERKKSKFKDWNDFIARVKGVGEKSASRSGALTWSSSTAHCPTWGACAPTTRTP